MTDGECSYLYMKKEYLSYEQISSMTHEVMDQVQKSNWIPTMILGLCRGGLMPAILMSHGWDIPMRSFNLSLRDQKSFTPDDPAAITSLVEKGHRVLVVDDINDSGATITWLKDRLQHHQQHVRFAVLLNKANSSQSADYSSLPVSINQSHVWWVFPWENKV